jgi:hypothetical protein
MPNIAIKRLFIIFIIYLLLLVSTFYVTYAYYRKEITSNIQLSTGDVGITMVMSFDEITVDFLSPYYDHERHVLLVNVSDPDAVNALSKLNIDVSITPTYASRIRIKWMESYIKERYYIDKAETLREAMAITVSRPGFHPFSNVMFGEGYQVIHHEDGYQYIDQIVSERESIQLKLADGGLMMYARSNDQFVETIYLEISLSIEVVQANRYQEVWKIDYNPFS